MIPIIAKNATTQMIATAFSCSGVGSVMPIAIMIPLVNETSNLMSITLVNYRPDYSPGIGLCAFCFGLDSSVALALPLRLFPFCSTFR